MLARGKDKTGFLLTPGVSKLHSQPGVWGLAAGRKLPAKTSALSLDNTWSLKRTSFVSDQQVYWVNLLLKCIVPLCNYYHDLITEHFYHFKK